MTTINDTLTRMSQHAQEELSAYSVETITRTAELLTEWRNDEESELGPEEDTEGNDRFFRAVAITTAKYVKEGHYTPGSPWAKRWEKIKRVTVP